MRVKVEVEAVTPLASATAVAVFASVAGAIRTELAEIVSAMVAVVESTPRLAKKCRNFSSARFTRFLAASSLAPKRGTDFIQLRPSK